MTGYLIELFNKKEQLMQQISRIDNLIKTEIGESGLGGGANNEAPQAQAAETQAPAAPAQPAPSSNPAYDKLSWKKKLLHHLGQSEGKGMSTSELVRALKGSHYGEWKSPSIPTLLYHMEKDGSIKIDRSAGRNVHFLSDGKTAAPAQQEQPQGQESNG